MRLSDYEVGYPIGLNRKPLDRKVDVTDVISILTDEGFNSFNEERIYHKMHGRDYNSLKERITSQLVGVPRDSYVEISAYGPNSDFLVIMFNY